MRVRADLLPGSEPLGSGALGTGALGSRELVLIRQLAVGASPDRLAELADGVDFECLADRLTRLRLLGLLGGRLTADAAITVPDGFRAQVDWILRAGRDDALYKQMLTWKLLQALEEHGVPAMPLKGPFMAERLHGDAGVRLSHDIDLLVAATHMRQAIGVIEDQGYVRPRVSDELPRRVHHIFEAADAPPIELHWRISWYESTYSRGMLARAKHDLGVRQPTPADELISLLVFHARDGLVGLRYPVDVAAWWDRYCEEPDLGAAWQIVRAHPALERPFVAAALAVERVLGVPIASRVGATYRRSTLGAVSLLDWAEVRPPAQTDAAIKIADGLVTAPTALPGWVRRVLLPALPGSGLRRIWNQAVYPLVLLWRSATVYWPLITRRRIPTQRAGGFDQGGRGGIEAVERARAREPEHL